MVNIDYLSSGGSVLIKKQKETDFTGSTFLSPRRQLYGTCMEIAPLVDSLKSAQ